MKATAIGMARSTAAAGFAVVLPSDEVDNMVGVLRRGRTGGVEFASNDRAFTGGRGVTVGCITGVVDVPGVDVANDKDGVVMGSGVFADVVTMVAFGGEDDVDGSFGC